MQIGMIGLGKMGMNMARRLLRAGHEVAAWNRSPDKTRLLVEEEGGTAAFSLPELVQALAPPRVVWMMLPAGKVVDDTVEILLPLLEKGDILIDGGNTRYTDDVRRSARAAEHGVRYLDMGVSGGIWGLAEGYCLMAGGERAAYDHIRPLLHSLAPKHGVMYCGPSGAGHFVKMIHNGIEYGMMQAYAEGFALLEGSAYGEDLDLAELSRVWNHGSVIRSWLLELAEAAFREDPDLADLEPFVDDSGEGRWTVIEAVNSAVPAPVLTLALMERFRSRQENSFSDRLLAALRNQFGGHAVKRKGDRWKR
jgi:6-phosphogluconate dehydrogenase